LGRHGFVCLIYDFLTVSVVGNILCQEI